MELAYKLDVNFVVRISPNRADYDLILTPFTRILENFSAQTVIRLLKQKFILIIICYNILVTDLFNVDSVEKISDTNSP